MRFFLMAQQPQRTQGSSIRFLYHTQTHHTHQHYSRQVIGSSHSPLSDNIQHSQQTFFHDAGGIRIRNPGKRAAEDRNLRQRGQGISRKDKWCMKNYKPYGIKKTIGIKIIRRLISQTFFLLGMEINYKKFNFFKFFKKSSRYLQCKKR